MITNDLQPKGVVKAATHTNELVGN